MESLASVQDGGMSLAVWGFIVALLGLIGPALVMSGIAVGRLTALVRQNQERIDRLEKQLQVSFDKLEHTMREAIDQAWRNCPLAHREDFHK